ncbi:MAG TPA: protein-L-isoaspartate(D-aspartate) O-methyltransferase [Kiritimatiellia bacterium]|jgi:protein-L-isoaspartate(D-aspartate) O-methyltransferase|nr:protein-L-isoaspartate(D-aspartate) O-methyltransferase [Kiritimatiellia bacterium]MBP9572934.1 protein-L-isoaspartate(D-aspartate) O-methyltransferase [Kiritimatiellia bacterium]HOR74245.1 protein-L-isoaspartate(D-aspartate) O-methyltransferase [Kiritimatiellia bacterium]HQF19952.1 protein-L-isoaspartate(D-aspartate) O-methyltransferase [Kiritimatiellia bacterium]HQG73940.1 protein-L-isoaspartate(D-aspartate) O-methyltransferase [Kiritimatiellia bacterium]
MADARLTRLLQEITAEAQLTAAYTGRAAFRPATMAAMAATPRHEFVRAAEQLAAYLDMPLPIGHGQTISQPYIVALMTDLLDLPPAAKVLEVGAGSGYQAAVLSRLARQVHTIEIVPALAIACRERLARLGYANVVVHEGDGGLGLLAEAPFEGIMVTAAAPRIPPALVDQLAAGGRLVIPVGAVDAVQELVVVTKDARGATNSRTVLSVRFVPLTGQAG